MMESIFRFALEAEDQGKVFDFLHPQMGAGEMLSNAATVMLVVFAVLFLMYLLISLASRVIASLTGGSKKASEVAAVPSDAASATSAVSTSAKEDESGEEFSSGTLKLKNCDEKTAAMIMAIVSDNTGIPLSELVFKSIKLVEEK